MAEIKLPTIIKPKNPLTPEGMRGLALVIAVVILLGGIGYIGVKSGQFRKGEVVLPSPIPSPTIEVFPTLQEETVSPIASPTTTTELTPPVAILSPTKGATPAASRVEVSIANFAYQPANVITGRGSTIVWTNRDTVAHTVTADDGSFDSGSIAPGDAFEQRFDKNKSYSYTCSFHPQMKGTMTIE